MNTKIKIHLGTGLALGMPLGAVIALMAIYTGPQLYSGQVIETLDTKAGELCRALVIEPAKPALKLSCKGARVSH